MKNKFLLAVMAMFFFNCAYSISKSNDRDALFNGFEKPPAQARPFVRWWWNGDHIDADEIKRELKVIKAAGFGGVEINPIAMPEEAANIGTKPVVWISKEWNQLVALAAKETKNNGMIADLIVGSGWPFGGEFLKINETIQRVITHSVNYTGGEKINENIKSLIEKALAAQSTESKEEALGSELLFISLVPVDPTGKLPVIDLTKRLSEGTQLIFDIPEGKFKLTYGILQRGHRRVSHGALGAAGPVMNHYNKEITLTYLNRLKKISEDTGIPLSELFRALFCDSIELAGANWFDGLGEIFSETYKYKIEPYLPYIFYDAYRGYDSTIYKGKFLDEIKRVRYDYNSLLVKVFLQNFTSTFQKFCTENGVLCRYQAYGTPFLMGILEGSMIPDIPESNNWIYKTDMSAPEWSWKQTQGYMMWNLYASSGGHLRAKKIVSCEAMTNVNGVFKTSLEEIKRHDDMNFITGINHTILHGFNYSPPKAGFPGWVRYGSYFSEQNTWWPYFSKWVDYNARLSHVFQNSQSVKNIAILGPTGDTWTNSGLTRTPFSIDPWYCYRLWEPLSQAGSSCDYINEKVIQDGEKDKGSLKFGPMSFQAIFLSSFRSIEPATALALLKFVKEGGKLVAIDGIPTRSLSYMNATEGDSIVKMAFEEIEKKYAEQFFRLNSPENEADLLSWTEKVLKQIAINQDIVINVPDKNVFQIRSKEGDRDIYFFVNSNSTKPALLQAKFPTNGKTPWIWNPEDGTRKPFPYSKNKNELTINLEGLESMLLVFEPDMEVKLSDRTAKNNIGSKIKILENPWQVKFEHMNGTRFEKTFNKLIDFGTAKDEQLSTFAGIVTYSTTFNSDKTDGWLELEKVNKGITEVYLNGKSIGVNWYGKPIFCLDNSLLKGENRLQIKYTTVLSNYCRSLKDNPTAVKWTKGFKNIPMGLEGEVKLFSK